MSVSVNTQKLMGKVGVGIGGGGGAKTERNQDDEKCSYFLCPYLVKRNPLKTKEIPICDDLFLHNKILCLTHLMYNASRLLKICCM